ncbi:MAG: choice-of-anchor Q domain-containing protein, partial [Paludibacter sp.]|nr:choice-of-anchor Q domain-containing protein [Paludibacter sp.]
MIASAAAVATISNSVFTGNTSAYHAAALMLTFSATVNNCLFYGNKGANVSYIGTNAATFGTFNNCTFASNSNPAGTASVGLYLSTPSAPNAKFTNCLFYNSGAKPISVDGAETVWPDVTYCGFDVDLASSWTGTGNIFTIAAASFIGAASNDYHLASGSVAIDAGISNTAYTADLDGFVRDANYDLGAYEYNPDYVPNSVGEIMDL